MEKAGVAEWQTHQTQNLAMATSCGFKSRLRHQQAEHDSYGACFFVAFFSEKDCFTSFLFLGIDRIYLRHYTIYKKL